MAKSNSVVAMYETRRHRSGVDVMIPSRTPAMVLAAAFATLCAATGCSHPQTQPAAVPTTSSVAPVVLAPASPGKASSTIYLSDRLRQACGITAIESVKEAPKFDFDKNSILPEDRDVLAQVAQCLTTGALKGRSVRLVGRADPRGTQEYNMALGARRSNAVLKYLAGLGVGTAQLSETSRGALDASGGDEATWQQDRRVDIDLLDVKP
jgi:peptidoglycan-associated lipoprotein